MLLVCYKSVRERINEERRKEYWEVEIEICCNLYNKIKRIRVKRKRTRQHGIDIILLISPEDASATESEKSFLIALSIALLHCCIVAIVNNCIV